MKNITWVPPLAFHKEHDEYCLSSTPLTFTTTQCCSFQLQLTNCNLLPIEKTIFVDTSNHFATVGYPNACSLRTCMPVIIVIETETWIYQIFYVVLLTIRGLSLSHKFNADCNIWTSLGKQQYNKVLHCCLPEKAQRVKCCNQLWGREVQHAATKKYIVVQIPSEKCFVKLHVSVAPSLVTKAHASSQNSQWNYVSAVSSPNCY